MGTIALLRDISIVILAIEIFAMCLVPGAILFFVVKGAFAVERKMRQYAPIVQKAFSQAAAMTDRVSSKVVAPVITVDTAVARVQGIRKAI